VSRKPRFRHILRVVAPFAIVAGTTVLAAPPAQATGYCAYVYPQPGTGVVVCTPWR
jgi:hypothetical protein